MAAKRLQTTYYANIEAAIEAEKKAQTDLVDQVTGSILRKLVAASVQDLPLVVGKTVRRKRRAYIMPLIPLSRPMDLYGGFSSRTKYYGAMAAKRLQTTYYANIQAAIEAEKEVPTDLVKQFTGSIIRKLVTACVEDLPPVGCAQDLPSQMAESGIDEEVQPAASMELTDSVQVTGKKVKQRRRTIWSRTKRFLGRMLCCCSTATAD